MRKVFGCFEGFTPKQQIYSNVARKASVFTIKHIISNSNTLFRETCIYYQDYNVMLPLMSCDS